MSLRRFINFSFHPAGYPIMGIFLSVSLIFGVFSSSLLWIGLILTSWCFYFFRDPERVSSTQPGIILSPADGLITSVRQAPLPPELEAKNEGPWTRVSIFLSIFDVHVTRLPVTGMIYQAVYTSGRFISATLDKSSELNERCAILIETPEKQSVACVQIAGFIARRIQNTLSSGSEAPAGKRYGIILFGSRLDVYIPTTYKIKVLEGQRTLGGETLLAVLKDSLHD